MELEILASGRVIAGRMEIWGEPKDNTLKGKKRQWKRFSVAGRELSCNFQEILEEFCLWELPLTTSEAAVGALLAPPGLKVLLPPGDASTILFGNSLPQ